MLVNLITQVKQLFTEMLHIRVVFFSSFFQQLRLGTLHYTQQVILGIPSQVSRPLLILLHYSQSFKMFKNHFLNT